jgi:hypothetical protein
MNDSSLIRHLGANGQRFERQNATVWFEAASMSTPAMDDFAELASQGVRDVETSLGITARASRSGSRGIRYFVSPDVQISYARSGSVFLPARRVRAQSAPYLHETVHALVPCRRCPLWFGEGLACYVQSYVSENLSGYDAPIFTKNGNAGVDADASRWLARRGGRGVLPFVGRAGEPKNLRADRERVATPFYVLSQSLMKFLAQGCEPAALRKIALARDFEMAFQKQLGEAVEAARNRWLKSLGRRQ